MHMVMKLQHSSATAEYIHCAYDGSAPERWMEKSAKCNEEKKQESKNVTWEWVWAWLVSWEIAAASAFIQCLLPALGCSLCPLDTGQLSWSFFVAAELGAVFWGQSQYSCVKMSPETRMLLSTPSVSSGSTNSWTAFQSCWALHSLQQKDIIEPSCLQLHMKNLRYFSW